MRNLSMNHEDRMAETFGDTVSVEEIRDARRQAEEMAQDPAIAAFYAEHADAVRESEIEGLDRVIKNLPKFPQPIPIDENEQIARLVVIALKLGMHDAAEMLKKFVDTDPNFSWDDIQLPE